MKKIVCIFSLILFVVGVCAQTEGNIANSSILYLKQDLKIGNVEVKKIGSDFIILSDSNIYVKEVVTNYYKDYEIHKKNGKSDPITFVVEKDDNGIIFKEDFKNTLNNSELDSKPDSLFALIPYCNYKISQGDLNWNICVRKKAKSPSYLDVAWLSPKSFRVGNDTIILNDSTERKLIIKDSLFLSSWDSDFNLLKYRNGKAIVLSHSVKEMDDSCFFTKKFEAFESGHTLTIGDTLGIDIESKNISFLFIITDKEHNNHWWWWIVIAIPLSIFFVVLKRNKIKAILRLKRIQKYRKGVTKLPKAKEDIEMFKNKKELSIMTKDLLKIIPKHIKKNIKHKLFYNLDDLKTIERDLSLIENANGTGKNAIKKCLKIRKYIAEHKNLWNAPSNVPLAFEEGRSFDKGKEDVNDNTPKIDLFEPIYQIIDSLVTQTTDGKSGGSEGEKECDIFISQKTLSQLKGSVLSLAQNVDKEKNNAIEKVKYAAEHSKQLAIDEAVQAEKKANELVIKTLEAQKSAAEEKAVLAEQSKKAAIDEAVQAERKANGTVIKTLEAQKSAAEKKAMLAEQSKKTAIDEAVQAERKANEIAIKTLETQKSAAENKAKLAELSKDKAVKDAELTVKRASEAKIKELNEEVTKVGNKLQITLNTLDQTQQVLNRTINDRDAKAKQIVSLEKSQEQFTRSLSSVPFAEKYCKQIQLLIKLGSQILKDANSLMEIGVKDPYFIIKALAKYGKSIDAIDMVGFLTEVNMAAKAQFVFKESSLASPSFSSASKDIEIIVKEYFFKQYLEKYINALMVLNESMCGLSLLIPEIKSQVGIFEKYRNSIVECSKQLQISILYVKVGDMAGENVDLKAKTIDVRIGKPGQILEIENCIIYPISSPKPQTKIKVTIKK